MHFYQNKRGRLVALLVLLLTQVHIFFKKNNLKVVTNEKGEAVGDVLTIIC